MPIGEGNDGKVYAVALSPDGQWVAAGGLDAHKSAKTISSNLRSGYGPARHAPRPPLRVVYHLAFSPDGSRLAATLGGGEGMRLWQAGSWRLLAEDKDYGGKESYGAAFDDTNRLLHRGQ